MSDCYFCELVEETRAKKNPHIIAETPTLLVMLDRHQSMVGRTLVFSKTHGSLKDDSFSTVCVIVRTAINNALTPLSVIQAEERFGPWHLQYLIHPIRPKPNPVVKKTELPRISTPVPKRQQLNDLKVVIQQALLALIHPDDKTWSLFKLHLTQNSPSELPARP